MTSSATSKRTLELRLSAPGDALDRFEAAWNRAAEGRPGRKLEILSFADLPLLLKTLSPARWSLLGKLRAAGPKSVYALAKLLGRDYKNVHTDVAALARLGLVEKNRDGLAQVAWDALRAELRLEGRALS